MADNRYRDDDYGSSFARNTQDNQWRDERFQRENGRSSARDYQAAGYNRDDDRNYRGGGTGYGGGDQGRYHDDGPYNTSGYGREISGNSPYERDDYGRGRSGGRESYGGGRSGGQAYRGTYASDGHRFADSGDRSGWGRDQGRGGQRQGGYGGQPQGYDYQDRGFFDRAGDEVRSWFGDEEAERRRRMDERYDGRSGGQSSSDDHYHSWRRGQIDALDRDYHEYRQENAKKFENEFGSWRSNRQTQRNSLSKVNEHMDVVGSDGEHVGTVDKVRGDRVILTKGDADAGGRHHSFPSSWIQSVDDKVTLSKTAEQAKDHWRDEERSGAFFGGSDTDRSDSAGRTNLNRSFSGTY